MGWILGIAATAALLVIGGGRACVCGSVQSRSVPDRLKTSGHHAGQGQIREKGADHDQTD